ncbi:MAG: 4-hydroxy-tetrahydrodipicolinate synthase [Cyanobacteriota bacterium]
MTFLGEIITAMVTPFDNDLKVDHSQAAKLAKFLVENGTETILISGTTGESPTLDPEEVKQLVSTVKKAVGSKTKLLVGAGTNNTEKSIKLAKEMTEAGADALLIVVPYYNKPSQEGMKAHFSAVASSVNTPIIMYNIQSRTGVNMLPETITDLAKKHKNIIAVKQSHPDMDQITEIIQNSPEGFVIYSGDDSLTLPMMSLGAYGVISVASHLIGSKLKEMTTNYKAGKTKEAIRIHLECYPVMKKIFIAPNPTPIKYALKEIGVLTNDNVRLPLVPINESQQKTIKEMLKDATNLLPACANR